ncbi:MAG: outer membrane lipoprotein carrier protein LolA [Rhodobacteraceae bacterium]|nr:outer membrane lipoprotein carrier protein LolA [Paracoccaceae bacterium]
MTRIRSLLVALTFALLPAAVAAQEIPLADLSAYLNSLTTAEASFSQQNADGSVSTGHLYIHRPGRARFEYDPPDRSLVIASSGTVGVFDPKSNTPPAQYPLGRTPLNLILARNIDLSQARMVVSHQAVGDRTVVVAEDPDHPEYGTIALVFSADPIALRQWVVTDDSGGQTTVTLSKLTTGGVMRDSLFDMTAEAERRAGR